MQQAFLLRTLCTLMPVPKIAETALQRIAGLDPFPQPSLIVTQYPVVLMHGFGIMAALRRGGHLHEEAMYLRQRGVPAFAPNVAAYSTVPSRALTWKERIEHVLDEAQADKVNLIAHSMGGLDARYLISKLGQHEVVASLTTISTPHHGTAIASLALLQPDRLRQLSAELVNWIGTSTLAGAEADVVRALRELTPEFMCETFNPSVPNHSSVRYWSYAGAAGSGTDVGMNPFLRPLNAYLYRKEGLNDGFVSVASARWGEFQDVVGADHARQVGIQTTLSGAFDADEFYCNIVRHLADEGL